MQLKNTINGYGVLSILLHWGMAIVIIALFWLGEFMEDLDYYSPWYTTAPFWHKAVGMLLFFVLMFRIIWVMTNTRPAPLASYNAWEMIAAKLTHYGFYLLLVVISISGYFITTAKGSAIDIFGWFEIPAATNLDSDMAEFMGETHEIAASLGAVLLLLHVAATVKHHCFDKDATLKRILKPVNQ